MIITEILDCMAHSREYIQLIHFYCNEATSWKYNVGLVCDKMALFKFTITLES